MRDRLSRSVTASPLCGKLSGQAAPNVEGELEAELHMECFLCKDSSHIDRPTERQLGNQQGKRLVSTLRFFLGIVDTMSRGVLLPSGIISGRPQTAKSDSCPVSALHLLQHIRFIFSTPARPMHLQAEKHSQACK